MCILKIYWACTGYKSQGHARAISILYNVKPTWTNVDESGNCQSSKERLVRITMERSPGIRNSRRPVIAVCAVLACVYLCIRRLLHAFALQQHEIVVTGT